MKATSYILLTLLYSGYLNANEYIQAVKYNDLERIEELNQGYEEISINNIDEKSGLVPIQYAALYNPAMIKNLLNNHDINIYRTTKSTKLSALDILLSEIQSETDEQKMKAIIEIINHEKNKDFPDWKKLFTSQNKDLIYKMIDKNLYMSIYYIYKNNIELNNTNYINYSLKNNPAMVFYFKKINDKVKYVKAIKKLIERNNISDIKMLLMDGKLYEYLTDISKLESDSSSYLAIKKYYKDFFNNLTKKHKIKKEDLIVTVPNKVSFDLDTKLTEYKLKLEQLKEIIENNKIENLKLVQNIELAKKNQELEIYKYKNVYDKRLYVLRIDKEKQCNKIVNKIKLKNIKKLEEYKSNINVLNTKIKDIKISTMDKNKVLIASNKEKDIIYTKHLDEINNLKEELKNLTATMDKSKQDFILLKKEDNKIYNYIYISIFFILLNIGSLFLYRKIHKKPSQSE